MNDGCPKHHEHEVSIAENGTGVSSRGVREGYLRSLSVLDGRRLMGRCSSGCSIRDGRSLYSGISGEIRVM
nr:hypothetical protein Iba_chr07bCG4770 [Ipomoea batatas]